MMNRDYSQREIEILEGVISLTKQGMNPYNLKVADIAKAANVGKGTIYDYFSSKEEAISLAIIYGIEREINLGYLRIKDKESLRKKYYEVLEIMNEGFKSNISSFNILLSSGGLQEFYKYIVDKDWDISQFIFKMDNIIDELLDIGYSEGVFSIEEDQYYKRMAVRAAMSGFSHYISNKELYKDTSMEKAMEVSYKLLLKGLN